MQVVGITTQHEVYVASKEHKFRMNEMVVLEDEDLFDPKGEVVETFSYNRYIPMGFDKGIVDQQVLQTLEQLGYDIGSDDIHLAKVRLFEEAIQPIQTGASVRHPSFAEIAPLLVKARPEDGLVLGEVKSTEYVAETLPDELKGLMKIREQEQTRKQEGVPFIFDIRAMQQYPHIGVFGGSGSGKSFGLRVMLEELMKLEIPTLVFDPHFEMNFSAKDEGQEDAPSYQSNYTVVQIGRDVGVDFSALSTRDVERLLQAAGSLSESMVNVIQSLHKRKDSYQSFSDRVGNLADALEIGRQKMDNLLHDGGMSREEIERYHSYKKLLEQYGSLPLASVKGIQWRLYRLNQAGLFQQSIRVIEESLHRGQLVVVQGAVWLLQVFSSYVVGALYGKRRAYKDAKLQHEQGDFFPPFVIVTDEAHNFAPKGYEAPAKPVLKEIAQEGRKYGVFLIFATQRPTLLDETITAQLNSKFVFRTVRGTDIQTIKEETDLTNEEGKRLPYLRSGDVFVSSAIMGRTMAVRIRLAHSTSPHTVNPFDELQERKTQGDDELISALEPFLPLAETSVMNHMDALHKQTGKRWDVSELKKELERLCDAGKLKKQKTPFATVYDRP
ncbi:ATP-binding protein [Halalkalibacterium halodurans]|uniref:ATP-binding protein n=1 Tax=Halalkalibacterium halodurans TaxID=86665 RepID=UPI002AA98975|nr:ATP-binding protein [Halalkalibacterium halodurans]MDY7220554.1 ATP-binding protein [Halalkalibacterium halodurans]MDY7239793.1 ATP-binding protein [Halalkalibacterium halodurans]